MTTLCDECLLHVFGFLDPFNLVSVAQVCTRWKSLAKRMFEKITSVHLNDPDFCPDRPLVDKEKLKSTNADKIKLVLRCIGEHVKSVQLGICAFNTITFNQRHSYNIIGNFDPEKFISTLAQTCTNIEQLQTGLSYIDSPQSCKNFEQLLTANGKLKKMILPDSNLMMFPSRVFQTVEEVNWQVIEKENYKNFVMPYSNLKKLTLNVQAPFYDVESILGLILPRVKQVKSLIIQFTTIYEVSSYKRMLSQITGFSQLEELEIWSFGFASNNKNVDLVGTINKLIKESPNLRVIKLSESCLKAMDISSFLALSKLEHLQISNLSFSSLNKIKSNKVFEHLTTLQIGYQDKRVDLSGLSAIVKRMPALKNLLIFGLSEDQSVEFSCKVIGSRVFDKDVVVIPGVPTFEPFKVFNDSNSGTKTEPLRLVICPQRKDYKDKVYAFVQNMKGCSVVGEKDLNDFEGVSFFQINTDFEECSCVEDYEMYSEDESESDEED